MLVWNQGSSRNTFYVCFDILKDIKILVNINSDGGLVVECSLTVRKVVGSIPGRVISDGKSWYSLPPC